MVADWILLLVSLGYAGALFAVAWAGDRRPLYPSRTWLRPIVYSLALAVYCSSWTFYGAVGSAATRGYYYLPIYLGPILLFVFGFAFFRRLVAAGKEHHITSIADFVAARYGKAQGLGVLVTVIAVTAAIPYIALQFKAVAMSVGVLGAGTSVTDRAPVVGDTAFYVAILLATFSILFGTRRIDATEHHHGMMLAVALESLVKLVAFVAVGLYALHVLDRPFTFELPTTATPSGSGTTAFLAQTMLAACAMFCLPRQFQVGVVECENTQDLRTARWLFPLYLAVISMLVIPIAQAGLAVSQGQGVPPDTFVLWLPLSQNADWLALVAYLGGFSAATGMVIVASVALATMVSNDLVVPMLLRWPSLRFAQRADISAIVLAIRRIAIIVLSLLAYAYYRMTESSQALASIGLLAFAAVAQFAPAIVGGLFWRGASRSGVAAGLGLGFALWSYTLLLPSLAGVGWLPSDFRDAGPFGIDWLHPQHLFGLGGLDSVTHGTVWSLGANIVAFVLVSMRRGPSVDERLRAESFMGEKSPALPSLVARWGTRLTLDDLRALTARIVGVHSARRAFDDYFKAHGDRRGRDAAHSDDVQFAERLLAGALGAASARRVLTSALSGTGMPIEEVVAVLDRTSQELRFNRALLAATLDNITQGISVVDEDMRLVAWNRPYVELFGYPEGMVHVGCPIADLIRYNAERGECGPGDVEQHVRKRIAHMRKGSPHVFERIRADGRVIEMRGEPLPDGGFATTFSDVTAYKRAEEALREANETLEARVAQRTAELARALDAQRAAKQEAEAANLSKTRFLAAASHDLLQPMNAARLFASAMREHGGASPAELAERIDRSLRSAEELLDGLLDISRLDAGALKPELRRFALDEVLRGIVEQVTPLADARGLSLRLVPTRLVVESDRRLLRRILQNFVSNALRYTHRGGVLIGARRSGAAVRIEVWDSGPGIAAQHLDAIFGEFERLDQTSPWGERGLGLGLSICERIARMLGHPLTVRSRVGRGSMFAVTLPRARADRINAAAAVAAAVADDVAGLRVLCVDNDHDILDGMRALLTRWSIRVTAVPSVDDALAAIEQARPDVLLVDYHLNDRLDGLQTLRALQDRIGHELPSALLTADGSDALKRTARAQNCLLLTKPIKPASLRAFLASSRSNFGPVSADRDGAG
ncbi:MAG TPA: PAS domain-containing hybrid sensor histidine kinase/response regulator [Patescibacteria group bacterium]|nr:PAS domain-containing hybrid sensor histidine kinase/response regulator [Patescibacteria group bacterium]